MKSEHRHELQRNELAKWLSELPEWLKRNQKMVIYIVVVVILVIISAYMTMYRNKAQKQQYQAQVTVDLQEEIATKYQIAQAQTQGTDNSMMLSSKASKLIADAEQIKNELLKSLAYIKAGDMLRAELQYKPDRPEKPVIEHQINTAKGYYNQALAFAGEDKNLISQAKFGLGLCEEELGNYDRAAQIYTEIVENPEFDISPAQFYAKKRLVSMVDYKKEVTFLPAPPKPVSDMNQPMPMTEEMTPNVDIDQIMQDLNTPAQDVNSN